MMLKSVQEQFANLRHLKRYKTSVSSLNALFWGTEVAKMVSQENPSFYSIRPQLVFRSVLKHFANRRHVKRRKTCVSTLNALFYGNEVAETVSQRNYPLYSSRPKMVLGSVQKHLPNLQHVKILKTCVSGLNALFRGNEVANMVSQRNHPFYSISPKMMFCSGQEHFANLRHVKICKTCVSGLNARFRGNEVAKMVSQ